MARIITVTSGKGGVGKTSISLNLSLALAAQGFKICLFDADLGLANVNILTGIYPEKDLESVIFGQEKLNDIIIKDYAGIDIIPGSNGVEKIADMNTDQTDALIQSFLELEDYDFFIFDTSAGISAQVLSFCMASHEIILVATGEPTSLTDAYSMLKVLAKYKYENPVKVVINQVKSGKTAQTAYKRIKQTTERFLKIRVEPLGIMAADKNVKAAVISQTPFFKLFPGTLATKCIQTMADRLINQRPQDADIPLELFWDKAIRFLSAHYPKKEDKQTEPQIKEPLSDSVVLEKLNHVLERVSGLESKIEGLTGEINALKQMVKKGFASVKRRKNKPLSEKTIRKAAKKPASPPQPAVNKATPALKTLDEPVSLDFESWYRKKISNPSGF